MLTEELVEEAQMILYMVTHDADLKRQEKEAIRITSSQLLVVYQDLWKTKGIPVELDSIPYWEGQVEGMQYGGPYTIKVTPKVDLEEMYSTKKYEIWLEERLFGSSGDNFNSFSDGGILKVKSGENGELDLLRLYPIKLPLWLNEPAKMEHLTAARQLVNFLEASL